MRMPDGERSNEIRVVRGAAFSAVGLGVSAGLRSALGPGLLSRAASRGELRYLEDTQFAAASHKEVR